MRRVRSPAGREAIGSRDAARSALDPATGLGRALDLALHGDDGVRRSARRPEELALARDPALVRERLGTSSVPLDLQLACLLGDEAIEGWERASLSAAEAAWFSDELVLLASPRAQVLAERLREESRHGDGRAGTGRHARGSGPWLVSSDAPRALPDQPRPG